MRILHSLLCLIVMAMFSANLQAQQTNDRFKKWDRNGDGMLTKDELPTNVQRQFENLDSNGDERVEQDEFDSFLKSRIRSKGTPRQQPARGLAPTHADVSYGDHEKQAFDIWLADTDDGKPTPLVIYIHGGGFRGGDKRSVSGRPQDYLDREISFASMNYRLSDSGPYPIMMQDCARGLQYIRSRAKEWKLDSQHVACFGGSAGAGISLWLGFHEDLANPTSEDPISRQSTRIVAAGSINGQSTYDVRTFEKWFGIPNLTRHPALTPFYAIKSNQDWESERVKKLMVEASPINHLSKYDPPVFMSYGRGDVPVDKNSNPSLTVHHARLGLKLKEAMDDLGLECHVTWPDHPSEEFKDIHSFLQAKVTGR